MCIGRPQTKEYWDDEGKMETGNLHFERIYTQLPRIG